MKKIICLILFCLLTACVSSAQEISGEQAPPGLVVLEFKWTKKSHLLLSWDNQISMFDAFSKDARDREGFLSFGGRKSSYVYSIKVRNDGEKRVKGIAWSYIFIDPDENKEIGKHFFRNYADIKNKKSVTLETKTTAPPSAVVSAKGLERDNRFPYIEKIEIRCVIYEDDSIWTHPEAKEGDCDKLKFPQKKSKIAFILDNL